MSLISSKMSQIVYTCTGRGMAFYISDEKCHGGFEYFFYFTSKFYLQMALDLTKLL